MSFSREQKAPRVPKLGYHSEAVASAGSDLWSQKSCWMNGRHSKTAREREGPSQPGWGRRKPLAYGGANVPCIQGGASSAGMWEWKLHCLQLSTWLGFMRNIWGKEVPEWLGTNAHCLRTFHVAAPFWSEWKMAFLTYAPTSGCLKLLCQAWEGGALRENV